MSKHDKKQNRRPSSFLKGRKTGPAKGSFFFSLASPRSRKRMSEWLRRSANSLWSTSCRPHPKGELLNEHEMLFKKITGIEKKFNKPGPTEKEAVAALITEMKQLCETLKNHFSREERCEELESLAKAFPRLGSSVRFLEKEHRDLLARIEKLSQGTNEFQDLHKNFKEFAQKLRRHERMEYHLLVEGYYTDIGSGD